MQPIQFNQKGYTKKQLLNIYEQLTLPRMIEEKMLILLRQGKISKWFSGYGQEAISVGCTLAMQQDEYMLPMHRNLGVFTTRGIPLNRLFAQFQGKMSGFTKGRDRSFHFGTQEYKIVGMISHLGPQLGVADGIALANKLKENKKATIVFTGDGGASEGDFHESVNTAAVWGLPVIIVVENNQWGLSTPSSEQFKCESFTDKGIGYGIKAVQADGNNILEVMNTISSARDYVINEQAPILVELISFRMRGHEEASGTKYYPEGLQDTWKVKDPVESFEAYLLQEGILTEAAQNKIKAKHKKAIQDGLDLAYSEPKIEPNTENELNDVYAPFSADVVHPKTKETTELRLVDAISEGLKQSLQKHENLVVMGQDIAEYGGVFKITEGFVDLFGKHRIRNTPLCESAIVGSALGLSINGYKAVMEMQFADFVTEGFTQIINNLAKIHWRWNQNADVVIRMPTGAGVAAGPFHSQSNEAWFFHTPGLKIVYPSNPYDAKGLLAAAINDPNPVLFFEHKALYRSVKGDVPTDYYTLEIGKATFVRQGNDATVITYGSGVHKALEFIEAEGLNVEVIDLVSLAPLDYETVFNSVRKTSRALVLHEDTLTGGIGAELSARITESCFEHLDAPVMRCASIDTAVPFDAALEQNFLPFERFKTQLKALLEY